MLHAFEDVFERGVQAAVLIGTDVPEIGESCIRKAFWTLQEKDLVFGRTADGGYYLVGMKKPHREAFGLGEYGHGRVLEETLREIRRGRAEAQGSRKRCTTWILLMFAGASGRECAERKG